MSIDTAARNRLEQLITESYMLCGRMSHDHISPEHEGECAGWITSAANLVSRILPDPNSEYRVRVAEAARQGRGLHVNDKVREVAGILRSLQVDIEAGLIGSLENQVSAATFDDLLDHAEHYLDAKEKDPAGVIAGVVFEDSVRRVYRNVNGQSDKGIELDQLINALAKSLQQPPIMSSIDAKQAKVAAALRTKATHAQWDEFDGAHVRTTITFTRQFISRHLDK